MKLTKSILQFALIPVASLVLPAAADPFTFRSQVNIPGDVSNGTAVAQFTSDFLGPDALKISPVTAPVNGWWYFDAVDENLQGTVDIFFYYTPGLALNASTVSISISAHFANGTAFDADAVAESAVITTDGNVSCGDFVGTGVEWTTTPEKERYEVKINSPQLGVTGTIAIESVAPGHYPCGPLRAGETMALAPKFGFSNSIPDGNTKVDLVLNGSRLAFTGIGYHDQRWTPVNFHESFHSWYHGHARLGPYSIVWYDGLAPDEKTPIISAYAAKDNKIINAKCSGLTVRPTGQNSTFPPGKNTGNPEGFHVTMDMGDGKLLEADVTPKEIVIQTPKSFSTTESEWYTRWIGTINGTVSGDGKQYHGVALFEEAVYY